MNPLDLAHHVLSQRHPGAIAAYWAGSLSRGEGTPTSDVDLVFVHAHLNNAWRDTFLVEGTPCETFVHDTRSLEVYYAKDAERGVASLMHMIAYGIPLLSNAMGKALQENAKRRYTAGPKPWSQMDIDRSRYAAGDLIDDLEGATDPTEIRAIGMSLFTHAFHHHRRTNGKWAAMGKHIVRTLRAEEGDIGGDYLAAFDSLFVNGDAAEAIQVVRRIYAPCGGTLSEWFSAAPPHT